MAVKRKMYKRLRLKNQLLRSKSVSGRSVWSTGSRVDYKRQRGNKH